MRRSESFITEIIETENVEEIIADAQLYALAGSTEKQYGYRFRTFQFYCDKVGESALPASPSTVLDFLALQSKRTAPKCVKLFKQAIRNRHTMADLPDPTSTTQIRNFMSGINRKYGTSVKKKRALRVEDMRNICLNYDRDGGLEAMRGKASLMTAFFGCLRASEVVGIDVENIEFSQEGLIIRIPKSKTDQEAVGQTVCIPRGSNPATDPVRAVEEWLDVLVEYTGVEKVTAGPLFPALRLLSSNQYRIYPGAMTITRYRLIIKDAVVKIGLDPVMYSGHSLRSGHATSAARAGANREDIKKQGRWKCDETLGGYIQEGTQFKDNSCNKLGL